LLQALETHSRHSVKKPPSEQKILTKEKWPILNCIALSMKIFCITNVLAGSFIDNNSCLKLQKKACRKQSAWRKKRK
jgi:hypothetical protein